MKELKVFSILGFLLVVLVGGTLGYLKWGQGSCDTAPVGILASADRAWRIDAISSSCSFSDDGTVRLEIRHQNVDAPKVIARWRGVAGRYDVYRDGHGDLNITLLSTMDIIERAEDIDGMKLHLRLLNPSSVLSDPSYDKWLRKPSDPGVREWAESHASLK